MITRREHIDQCPYTRKREHVIVYLENGKGLRFFCHNLTCSLKQDKHCPVFQMYSMSTPQ